MAMVNCRILPGHSAEEIRLALVRALNNSEIAVRYVREFDGREFDTAPAAVAMPAMSPPSDLMIPLHKVTATMWPETPIVVAMAAGESDAVWTTSVGMPTFAVNGLAIDRDDVRAHAKDERLAVAAFDRGVEFQYRFMKALTTSQ